MHSEGVIEETIRRICAEDPSGYYTPMRALMESEALDYTPLIWWIIGARRIGKTDFFLRLACRLFMDHGLQTMWVRGKKVELEDPGFYADFLNDAFHFKWCPEGWTADAGGVWTEDREQVIKWQSISTFSNRRGAGHPDVYMIVFDEFTPESRDYPRRALTGLMSLTKTVIAGKRDARVYCLSNFVSLANPYFAGLRIYPERDITHYPDKAMLIDKCKGYRCSIERDNPWQAVYRAASYGDYADETEDSLIELVKRPPKRAKPLGYAVQISGEIYMPASDDRFVYWIHKPAVPYGMQVFASEVTEVSDRVPLIPDIVRRQIEAGVKSDELRFDSPNTLYSVMSLAYTV